MIAVQQAGLGGLPRIGEGLFEALESAGLPLFFAQVIEFGFEHAVPFDNQLGSRLEPRGAPTTLGRFPVHAGAQIVLDEFPGGGGIGVWVDPRGAPFLVLSLIPGPSRGPIRTLCVAPQHSLTQSPPSAFVVQADQVIGVVSLLHDRLVFTNRLSLDTEIGHLQEIDEAQFKGIKTSLSKIAGPLVKQLSAPTKPELPGSIWEVSGRTPPPADPWGDPAPSGPPLTWEPGRGGLGATPDQAILCHDPDGERAYLARLRCPKGEPYSYQRVSSVRAKCREPHTHEQAIGSAHTGLVSIDLYRLECACGAHQGELYFDMYHPGADTSAPAPSAPAQALPATSISEGGRRRIYRLLCNLAACDGNVDPTERAVLDDVLEHFQIPQAEAKSLEAEGAAGSGLRIGKNPAERLFLLGSMIDVAAADGVLDPQEQRRLGQLAAKVGLSDVLDERLDLLFPNRPRR
jgi:tellurite resistance protein